MVHFGSETVTLTQMKKDPVFCFHNDFCYRAMNIAVNSYENFIKDREYGLNPYPIKVTSSEVFVG